MPAGREPYHLRIELDWLPDTNPAADANRWERYRQKKTARNLVWAAAAGKTPAQPLEMARVVFTRRSSREPEDDNLRYGFKALRDALGPTWVGAGKGIIVDDDAKHLIAEYRWEKAPRGDGSVVIEVFELDVDPDAG